MIIPAETVLCPGRRAGMQTAITLMQTSEERQYQLSILSQVGFEFTFCQFMIVRIMQHAAVLSEYPYILNHWETNFFPAILTPPSIEISKTDFFE